MRAVILEGAAVNPGDISWDPVCRLMETDIWDNTTETDKWEKIKGHEIVFTNKVVIDEAVFQRNPDIKYVGVCATGYNVVDLEAAERHNVTVTNIPAYSTDSVVQLTIGLMIDLASKITMHDKSVKSGDWIHSETFCYWNAPIVELTGKTLGIYGFGNIGRKVASVAEALGMNVCVHTKNPEKYTAYQSQRLRFVSDSELFSISDIISFHCPLTAETKNLVNRSRIAEMKDGAMLINVSRGPVIQEEDLCEALHSGKLAGAALDVIESEPMKKDSPLLNAPNLIITPHIGWASREARIRLIDIAAENLQAFLDGRKINVVNLK